MAECAARKQGTAGGNYPADCDWPHCGCDEHADKVLAALQEEGWASPTEVAELRFALTHAAKTFRKYEVLHREKGTADGATKANSNMIIAQVCERALGQSTTHAASRPDKVVEERGE